MISASDRFNGNALIGTILKHDKKVTSYKIALLRAINDVVLSFPLVAEDTEATDQVIALPLRMLAEFWVAYYFPFCDPNRPILQGPVSVRDGHVRNDVSFRPALSELQIRWQAFLRTNIRPADGFFLLSQLKTARYRRLYPPEIVEAYDEAVRACAVALTMPIRYAGDGQYTVFDPPQKLRDLPPDVTALPGTQPTDLCLVLTGALWTSFRDLSLWIEALAVHEWCLFTERVATVESSIHRGDVYFLLTARPDNRRPLTWERNRVGLLLIEGHVFTCPWTQKRLNDPKDLDMDHLLPLSVYPVNELWNLLPADKAFNQHTKRDRIPSLSRLQQAQPFIARSYEIYESQPDLKLAMRNDAGMRFSNLFSDGGFTKSLADQTVRFIEEVANARSVARF